MTTECPDWAQRWPTYVEEFAPDIVLVPVSQWMILDREVDGRNIPFDSDEMRQRIEKYYGQMIDALSQDGSLVVLTTVIPNVESTNAASIEKNLDDTRRREVALNEIIAELVASRSEDAELIDLAGWICDGTDCTEEIDGVRLRPDGGTSRRTARRWQGPFSARNCSGSPRSGASGPRRRRSIPKRRPMKPPPTQTTEPHPSGAAVRRSGRARSRAAGCRRAPGDRSGAPPP